MSEFLINIRLNQKVISSLKVNPQQTIQQIKQYISAKTNKLINVFYLYINGQLITSESNQITLGQIGIQNQSTIDIVQQQQTIQNIINVKFEYGMQIYMIDIFQQDTIQSVKEKIGVIIGCGGSQFELVINNQNCIQQNEKISNYRIGNDTIISVKRRLLIEGLRGSFKSKLVQSVVSSQQHPDEKQSNQKSNDDQPNENKLRSLQKRTSCSASLHSIYDPQEKVKHPMKHSGIEPYTMHKNQREIVEQKQKIKRKIEDIKQTISFGSLQQSRPQETQVQIINEDLSIYYRFCCPFGCKINNLKQKLAKAQRIEIQSLEILQTEDQALVQELTQIGQPLRLKYKIKV